jgi:hypothetical protein
MHKKRGEVNGMHMCKKWKPYETESEWTRNCNCSYYNNNVKPICACFTVTHFHKLLSPFWLPKGKMLSGFAIRHPGQRRITLLIIIIIIIITILQSNCLSGRRNIETFPSLYKTSNILSCKFRYYWQHKCTSKSCARHPSVDRQLLNIEARYHFQAGFVVSKPALKKILSEFSDLLRQLSICQPIGIHFCCNCAVRSFETVAAPLPLSHRSTRTSNWRRNQAHASDSGYYFET